MLRVVNENMETITEYDLTKGYLIPALVIKEDATPIDDETKFAWEDEDYEEAQMYIQYSWVNQDLTDAKNTIIQKMSRECEYQICSGVTVDGANYSLNIEDQMNMSVLLAQVNAGVNSVPYHADGEACRYYSAEEFSNIAKKAIDWIAYQQSYFNSLRDYILSITTTQELSNVTYGMDIPDDYQTTVLKDILSSNNEEF